MTLLLLRLIAFTLCLFTATLVRAQVAFAPDTLQLVGTDQATVSAFIRTEEPELTSATLEAVEDLGPVSSATVMVTKVTFSGCTNVSNSSKVAEWKCAVEVSPIPTAALSERSAKLTFALATNGAAGGNEGGAQPREPKPGESTREERVPPQIRSARYKLRARVPAVSWNATVAGATLRSPPNDELEIAVVSLDGDASGLHIESSSLRDASSNTRVNPAWLALCAKAASKEQGCAPPDSLSQGVRKSVYVRFNEAISNGNYVGAINLAVKESPESKSVEVTSFSRSRSCSRWLGIGALTLGLALSLLGGTFARGLSTASSALVPAARLLESVNSRLGRIREYESSVPITKQALSGLTSMLSRRTLLAEGFVPRALVPPFGGAAIDTAKYAAYLQAKSDRLTALAFLIEHGLAVVDASKYDPSNPAHVAARQNAFAALDQLAQSETKSISELSAEIPPIIAAYEAARKPPPPPNIAAAAGPRASPFAVIPERPTLESLTFRINTASAAAWVLSIVATLVTGYAVLIATNHGFGLEMDFVKCFLWGVGVQFAGQQLGNVSPGSVATSLGFKAPT